VITAQPRIRPAAALLAVLLLAVAALWGTASPAAAHDELLSSDPAADTAVDVLPDTLTLTFSGELLGGSDANEVQVTDAAGTTLNDGPAVLDGTTLTQSLAGDASGSIQVLWRVVSSDGHPISGEFAFTVGGTAEPTASPSDSAAAAPTEAATPDASAEPLPSPSATTAADEEAGGFPTWIWVVLGLVAVGILGAVVYLLMARARGDRPRPEADADR
jgi:methionine-rich copper-binding protein CopC